MTRTQITLKSYAYIVHDHHLLVFEHTQFPEAGIQVPGGSVELGEDPVDAVIREAMEETGLKSIRVVRPLGKVTRDLGDFGLVGLQERYYFHLTVDSFPGDEWLGYEMSPSDGSPGPIEFRFYWVPFDQIPSLSGGQDEMIDRLLG